LVWGGLGLHQKTHNKDKERSTHYKTTTKTGALTYTSDKPVNISGFDNIHVISEDIMEYQRVHSTNVRDRIVLCKPFINVSWGSTIHYELPLNSINGMSINFTEKVINLRLLDQFYRELDLLNDWSLKLKLYKNDDFINL
jgi:hypothetical protein